MRAFSARRPLVGVSTVAGLVSLIMLLIVPAAIAGPSPTHCVSQVVQVLGDGEMLLGPDVCFPTLEEALAYGDANFTGPKLPATSTKASKSSSLAFGGGTQAAGGPSESTSGYRRIATHYDGSGGSGSSRSFYGYCSGGYINLSSYGWANRISSTYNGCNRIKHHDGNNASGGYCSTWGVGTTDNVCSAYNNKANSTSYHS